MYNRAFPIGNALFFFTGGMMSLFCLPCGKLAFAQHFANANFREHVTFGSLQENTVKTLAKRENWTVPALLTRFFYEMLFHPGFVPVSKRACIRLCTML